MLLIIGCFKCGEDGHISRDCPSGGGRTGGKGICQYYVHCHSFIVFLKQVIVISVLCLSVYAYIHCEPKKHTKMF